MRDLQDLQDLYSRQLAPNLRGRSNRAWLRWDLMDVLSPKVHLKRCSNVWTFTSQKHRAWLPIWDLMDVLKLALSHRMVMLDRYLVSSLSLRSLRLDNMDKLILKFPCLSPSMEILEITLPLRAKCNTKGSKAICMDKFSPLDSNYQILSFSLAPMLEIALVDSQLCS